MPRPSRKVSEEYHDVVWIGSGQHGDVYKCIHMPTGKVCARKYISKHGSPDAPSQLVRELSVLIRNQEAACPQVLCLQAVWRHDHQVSLILEYCKGGSLDDWIKKRGPLNEPQLATVARDAVTALVFMRDNFKLHHRDLKPANILIDGRGRVKISDFGESGLIEHFECGTVGYKAPECLDNCFNATCEMDLEKADVWSLGILLVELASGVFPFHSLSMIELFETVRNDPSPGLDTATFSSAARHFVEECLRKSPETRASLDFLSKHPFLQKASDRAFTLVENG